MVVATLHIIQRLTLSDLNIHDCAASSALTWMLLDRALPDHNMKANCSSSIARCQHGSAVHTRLQQRRRQLVCRAASQASGKQTALITGSSTGIGKAVSLELAQKGWRVFSGVRSEADADRLRQLHADINPVVIDVTSDGSIAATRQEIRQQLGDGGLNLLVNNAGVGLVAPAEFVPLDQWRGVLDVNLQGPLAVTQAFLPMLRQGQPQRGRIINISSVAGHLALPCWSAYNVSKAGLDMLSECLRYELAAQGIPVVCVKPGPVQTPIWGKSRSKSEAVLQDLPPEAQELYGETLDKMREMVAKTEQDAIPVSDVVRVVMEAATAPQPKGVYLVGKDAGLNYWAKRLMPDAAWTNMILKALS